MDSLKRVARIKRDIERAYQAHTSWQNSISEENDKDWGRKRM